MINKSVKPQKMEVHNLTTSVDKIQPGKILEYRISNSSGTIKYSSFLDMLSTKSEFRSYFNGLLADVPFKAFRLETPAVSKENAEQPFTFVVIDNPELERTPDRQSFKEYFGKPDDIAIFSNLSGDARLIIPTLPSKSKGYGHIASFVRLAPKSVQDLLWKTVADEMTIQLNEGWRWLSTAGDGVSWLHVRIDTMPKYYFYKPYSKSTII